MEAILTGEIGEKKGNSSKGGERGGLKGERRK